jgi:glutamate racemase
VVIACNTASTIALPAVRAALDLPVVGTVPAIKPAAARSRTRTIGVLGTDATVRQAYVDDLAARFAADCRVVRHGSGALVALAEAKLAGAPPDRAALAAAVAPLRAVEALDTVVLACTHFPLLADELGALFGPGVALVDGGAGIARRVAHLTAGSRWPATAPDGVAVFTRLGPAERALAPALARWGLSRVEAL